MNLVSLSLRHYTEERWNNGKEALVQVVMTGGGGKSRSAWLSRNYTQGARKPTAFVKIPPASVLCMLCQVGLTATGFHWSTLYD